MRETEDISRRVKTIQHVFYSFGAATVISAIFVSVIIAFLGGLLPLIIYICDRDINTDQELDLWYILLGLQLILFLTIASTNFM